MTFDHQNIHFFCRSQEVCEFGDLLIEMCLVLKFGCFVADVSGGPETFGVVTKRISYLVMMKLCGQEIV